MLTRPAAFQAQQMNTGVQRHTIIKIVIGATTWLFSDIEMELTEGHVYSLLLSTNGVSEGIDIFRRTWRTGDVDVSISNLPYKKDSSIDDVRISDELSSMRGAAVTVYFAAGDAVTALTDCLTKFIGTIIEPPSYDQDTLTFTVVDNGRLSNIDLPTRIISDEYTNAPDDNATKKIPLCYGEYTNRLSSSDDIYSGLGLAKAYKAEKPQSPSEFIIADHDCDTTANASRLYHDVGVSVAMAGAPQSTHTHVGTGPSSGTIKALDLPSAGAHLYFGINDTLPSVYDDETYLMTNPSNAHDGSLATVATLKDNLKDDSTNREGLGCFGIINQDVFRRHIFEGSPSPKIQAYWYDIIWTAGTWTTGDDIFFRLYYSRDGSAENYLNVYEITTDSIFLGGQTYGLSTSSGLTSESDQDMVFAIFADTGIPDASADGTTSNSNLMTVEELDIAVFYEFDEMPLEAFAAVKGREYDSWITSRSSSYSDGDTIEDPAGIVESLLRDEMGVAAGDIDLPSFISAENTNVQARINLHSDNEMTSFDAIRQLSEQSTFAFFFSGAGDARLIRLDDATPTTATRGSHSVVIPMSHIVDSKITISKEPSLVNTLEVDSRYQQEYKTYRDHDEITDATSVTNFGIRRYPAKWPNILGLSALHISEFLVSDADGIWSNEHSIIELSLAGYTGSDIEVGDWIELDAATVDPHYKLYGSSFSGIQFLVTNITANDDHTAIKAIELY